MNCGVDEFSLFAKAPISSGASVTSLVELLDKWLDENPSQDDLLAIQASLRDMEQGETGTAFDEFTAEFRNRNGLPNNR